MQTMGWAFLSALLIVTPDQIMPLLHTKVTIADIPSLEHVNQSDATHPAKSHKKGTHRATREARVW